MNFAKTILATAVLALPLSAAAQNGYPQPYSPDDPDNYGSPASQQYGRDQPQRHDPNEHENDDPDQAYNQGQQAYDNAQAAPYAGQRTVDQAPPPIPEYAQPDAPGPAGYYWIPGAWRPAPYTGALWTPGYWAYAPIGYYFNPGYWGLNIGYYGGINYGYGYFGQGFCGGYWNSGRFFYNREYSRGRFDYSYNQRFPGVVGVHPGGRGYAPYASGGEGFRTGASIQRSFAGRGGDPLRAGQFPQRGLEVHDNTMRAGNRGTEVYGNRLPYQGGAYSNRPPYQGSNNGYANRQIPTTTYNRPTPGQSFGTSLHSRPIYSAPAGGFNRGPQPSYGGGGGGGYHSAPASSFHPSAPSGNLGGGNRGGGGGFQGGGGNRGHR